MLFLACQVVTVHLFDNNGSSASDCFVELEAEVDLKDALKKSGQTLDKKYIESKIFFYK